jgi:outer membrane protein, multidrug efflux system
VKSEIRDPKSERSPKSETRIGWVGASPRINESCAQAAQFLGSTSSGSVSAANLSAQPDKPQRKPRWSCGSFLFGIRFSDFLRPSALGFRISSAASLASVLLVVLIAALAGCAVGPDYKRPSVDTPAAYRTSTAETNVPAGPSSFADLGWWQVFQDPQLTAYLGEALTNNWDIKIAAARVLQAEASLRVARSQFFPTVSAGGDLVASRSSQRGPVPLPPGLNPERNYGDVFGAMSTYEVDLWGKIRRANEAARAQLVATQDAQQTVRQTLVADVAIAYLDLLALDYDLEISRRTLEARNHSLELTDAREKGGVAAMQDVAQAKILVYGAEASIVDFQRLREQQENALCILLGRNPASIQRGPGFTNQQVRAEVPAGLPSSLLERRPDIRFAEQQLVAANANIGQAKAAFYPQLSLTGAYGYQTVQFSDLFNAPARTWQFGPSVSMPLFTGGRLRANLKITQAQYEEALATYQKTVQSAFGEVSDGLIAYQRTREFRERQAERTRANREATDLAYIRYDGGVTSYLEVLYNEQELFTAELNLAQARLNELLSVVQLYRALGGGWQTPVQQSQARN